MGYTVFLFFFCPMVFFEVPTQKVRWHMSLCHFLYHTATVLFV